MILHLHETRLLRADHQNTASGRRPCASQACNAAATMSITTSVIMLVGKMSLKTELLVLASTAHTLTCADVRTDISVARFAFTATASRLYTSNQAVASQALTVSLSILLCTFNHTGHAILMCLLQLTVSLAKSVWRHCLANSFCTKTVCEHSQ